MDRGKSLLKKPTKLKGHMPTGDLIALGSKSKDENKTSSSLSSTSGRATKSNMTVPPLSLKRDAPGSLSMSVSVSKKHKSALGRSEPDRRVSPSPHTPQYMEVAKEVEPGNFFELITDAQEHGSEHKIAPIMCGAVKSLSQNRAKPEQSLVVSLLYLSKTNSSLFVEPVVIEGFSSLLKRDISLSYKARGNHLVSVLACNLLMAAFLDDENWPDNFVKVYIEDSLGDRVWVDREDCQSFVHNIQTSFNTKLPAHSVLVDTVRSDTPIAGMSPNSGILDDDDKFSELSTPKGLGLQWDQVAPVLPRYSYQQVSIEVYTTNIIRENLNRRQTLDGASRNLLKLIISTAGYSEVRTLAMQRLEIWLQNPKLSRSAQDVMMAICINCDQHTAADVDVISQLCKLRIKNKQLHSHYLECMRELLNQNMSNLRTVMAHIIYNELSNARNPNNMAILGKTFSHAPVDSAKMLAEIFQDLLTNRDDYLRALRALLREIVRSMRQDVNFTDFAQGLLSSKSEAKLKELEKTDSTLKERYITSLIDLVALTCLVSVSPKIREAAAQNAHSRADAHEIELLHSFRRQISVIQKEAILWLQDIIPKCIDVKTIDYLGSLRKVLFVEKQEAYHKVDSWPPEGDRNALLRLVSEVPVLEDTLMRVLLLGLDKDIHISAADALDLADQLIRKAARLHNSDGEVLKIERLEFIDAVFNLCTYHYPENIVLPAGYTPPVLAVGNLYWKVWMMLLILASFNPVPFGVTAWEKYPTLRYMMEMMMTSSFVFPPPTETADEKEIEKIKIHEKQLQVLEKQQILEFEGHLAAATSKVTITEANSHLLDQLTLIDPVGVARRPPAPVLEQLKSMNQVFQLGNQLCRSRKPDYLVNIIERQGSAQSMPWLADLVESSESSLEILPIQCLCEFLLRGTVEEASAGETDGEESKQRRQQRIHKHEQLLMKFQMLIHSNDPDTAAVVEVLEYFLKLLPSPQAQQRHLAVKGFTSVLSKSHLDDDDLMDTDVSIASKLIPTHAWLLDLLHTIPIFPKMANRITRIVRQAMQIETDAAAISAYIIFLSQHAIPTTETIKVQEMQEMDDLALDIAQVIVERGTLLNFLLPQGDSSNERAELVLEALLNICLSYTIRAQQTYKQKQGWSGSQDQIRFQWHTGECATMNILVVHAMIILLTYTQPKSQVGQQTFAQLLYCWFPKNASSPIAYLIDTSEEVLLLHDWLKLRMIRSTNYALVEAALQDLETGQLLLFVQSFGLPVPSMSKLLQCLDQAVQADANLIEEVVVDKGYMSQLIEVQHMRGAQGGDLFYHLLTQSTLPRPHNTVEEPLYQPAARTFRSSSSQLSRSTLSSTSLNDVKALLKLIFVNRNTNQAEKQQKYAALLKGLTQSSSYVRTLVQAIKKLLTGSDGSKFAASLAQLSSMACPIINIISATLPKDDAYFQQVLMALDTALQGSKSSLYNVVHASLSTVYNSHASHAKVIKQKIIDQGTKKSPGRVTKTAFKKDITECLSSNENHTELTLGVHMAHSIGNKDMTARVKTLCKFLSDDIDGTARLSSPISTGLIVDWLEVLDPEIISVCLDIQQQLLFSRQQTTGQTPSGHTSSGPTLNAQNSSAYLLSLLVHQSSWRSLNKCVNVLLMDDAHKKFNASLVLDFLWACIRIPKIWQGRDKKLTQRNGTEDILCLDDSTVCVLVQYILDEAQNSPHCDISTSLQQRMPLLLMCCQANIAKLAAILDVTHERAKNKSDEEVCQQLILQLYMGAPGYVTALDDKQPLVHTMRDLELSHSQLDVLTHRMLTSLGKATPGPTCENRMYDANIACRKLAVQHPLLMLRQLPMMAALLRGRAQYTIGEMKHRNHLLLYTHILGLLELLQPQLFTAHTQALADVFQAYYQLFKVHGTENRVTQLIFPKFIYLINNYLSYDAVEACKMMRDYVPLLNSFVNDYSGFAILKSLIAGLTIPRQDKTEKLTEKAEANGSHTDIQVLSAGTSTWTNEDLVPHRRKISHLSPRADVLSVLSDLEQASKKKVEILTFFEADMKRLMVQEDSMIRNTTQNLVMRYIRHRPGSASGFVPCVLQCLSSKDNDIVNSCLVNLPEFTLLAQEHAGRLLKKAFNVGINNKIETVSYINDTLQLLNMETI